MRQYIRCTLVGVLSLGLLFFATTWLFLPYGRATGTSAWINTTDLGLASLGTIPAGHAPPDSLNGNIDCSQQLLTTKPEIYSPAPSHILLQQTTTIDACVIHTAYGSVDTRSLTIQPFYADLAGSLTPYNASGGFLAVPNSLIAMSLTSGGYLQISTNILGKLKASTSPLDKTVSYSISSAPDFFLTDKAGHPLPVSYDSISFSADGLWMVVSSPGHALLRVNLSSFEIVAFGPAFDYNTSTGPNPQTAISNDGRYVVAGSSSFRTLKIYDLNTCTDTPTSIDGPVNCQSRDLWASLLDKISGFISMGRLRFVDNDILSLYAASQATPNQPLSISKYNLSPGGLKYSQLDYLAIGDSFSSGEGAYSYIAGTDTSNNRCHLSSNAYPVLITQILHINSSHSVACSGATMPDILGTGNDYKGQVHDKIPLLERNSEAILESYSPGYLGQIQFVAHYSPKAITITVSGDDIGFSDIVKECVANVIHPTCYASYEDQLELLQSITAQYQPLTTIFNELRRNSSPDGHIYAVGYPQLVKPGGNCALNVHLDNEELQLAVALVGQLNNTIRSAAISAGINYVDISESLAGHRLCETASYNSAVNGLTLGNDIPRFSHGPIGNESYHPNQLGHQLMAKAILSATSSLNLGIPLKAVPTAPLAAEKNPALDNKPVTSRKPKTVIRQPITDNTAEIGKSVISHIKGAAVGVSPKQPYVVSINGQPLATVTSSPESNLDFTFQIPATMPTGYQIISINGDNLTRQPIVIQQLVYLYNPADALNNSAPSSLQQGCGVVTNSGQDVDTDGIDDACDDFIGTAQTTLNTGPGNIDSNSLSTTNSLATPTDNQNLDHTIIQTGSARTMTLSPNLSNSALIASATQTVNKKVSTTPANNSHLLGAITDKAQVPKSSSVLQTSSKAVPYDLTKAILLLFLLITSITVVVYSLIKIKSLRRTG